MIRIKPKYYVHMGPRTVERVSIIWKALHITIFLLLICSSSVATTCIYYILDMYRFNCIIYARVSFEQTYEERLKDVGNGTTLDSTETDATETTTQRVKRFADSFSAEHESDLRKLDCVNGAGVKGCENNDNMTINQDMIQKLEESNNNTDKPEKHYSVNLDFLRNMLKEFNVKVRRGWKNHPGHYSNENINHTMGYVNNTGYLNMRKTIFSTIYMCNLMLFAPLVSILCAFFLGALIAVGGKGGAGNPGDLLPNPWICVYPFMGLCVFMMVLNFISDTLFHKGLNAFCLQYYSFTKFKWCTKHIDQYNVQFSTDMKGPPKPFYLTYIIGSIGVQLTAALWVIQTLMYIFRILCLADFTLYMTRIGMKGEKPQQGEFANVVLKMLDKHE